VVQCLVAQDYHLPSSSLIADLFNSKISSIKGISSSPFPQITLCWHLCSSWVLSNQESNPARHLDSQPKPPQGPYSNRYVFCLHENLSTIPDEDLWFNNNMDTWQRKLCGNMSNMCPVWRFFFCLGGVGGGPSPYMQYFTWCQRFLGKEISAWRMEWTKELECFCRQVPLGRSCPLMAVTVVSPALLENVVTCTRILRGPGIIFKFFSHFEYVARASAFPRKKQMALTFW
jgi:hypothetical protein